MNINQSRTNKGMYAVRQEYKKSSEIRNLLLDSAESLFAEKGFFGTTVRDITDKAALRSASINYHFETKEKLFLAVIDRRIDPLAAARLVKLDQIIIDPDTPEVTVSQIIEAFAGPMLDFAQTGGQGWKNYCTLIAHLGVQKIWSENTVSDKYNAHAEKFITALQRTFPKVSHYRIHCCFQFLLSTTLYVVCDNKRLDTLSHNAFSSGDLAQITPPFLDFVTQGIIGVASAQQENH